ncbi:MAG: ELM1/GtrOC1 family putative glycosyltransferase [Rickettsiales bacterium]
MAKDDKILIIADDRVGTYSQAVALAEESGLKYQIIQQKYNFLKFLPNFIFSKSPIRITKNSLQSLTNLDFTPNYIISAGRKSAPTALFLQSFYQKKTQAKAKIIQILKPEINFNYFDFVLLPFHDNIPKKFQKNQNIIKFIGSLSKNLKNISKNLNEDFANKIKNFTKPIILVLVGGNTKNYKFPLNSAENMFNIVKKFTQEFQSSTHILNSRRTPSEINEFFLKNCSDSIFFYDYNLLKDHNPYYDFIFHCDLIIASGDSISMISEACSLGKKIIIFNDGFITSKKHQKFIEFLLNNNYALSSLSTHDEINEFKIKTLNECEKICKIIF